MQLLEFQFQYVQVGAILVFAVLIGLLLFEFHGMKDKIEEMSTWYSGLVFANILAAHAG